jgi:xanthine dehydrogenase accessory factor
VISEVEALTHRTALRWLDEGRRVVAATLVEVDGSAPMEVGATMLIDSAGNVEGSVTGGCVEAAVAGEAEGIFAGAPPLVASYGISDAVAGGVGLMCGGQVRIAVSELVEADRAAVKAAWTAADAGRPATLVALLDGPLAGRRMSVMEDEVIAGFGPASWLPRIAQDARALLAKGVSMVRRYGSDGAALGRDLEFFFQSFSLPRRMIIVGAVDFSAALAPLAAELGYRVTICDPREPFLASSRYSRAAEVVAQWPHEYLARQQLAESDVVLVFTHDPKFDEPALRTALESKAGFVGALGSRKTHADRRERLMASGVARHDVDRIVCPCGLDIGPATPSETAVSILAELVAVGSARSAGRLVNGTGPIRRRTASVAGANG